MSILFVPPGPFICHCTVATILVIVSVQCGELNTIEGMFSRHAVPCSSTVSSNVETVVLGFIINSKYYMLCNSCDKYRLPECFIFCPSCPSIMSLKLHPELHVSWLSQLMDEVISKPELLFRVTKPILVISPGPFKILLWFTKVTSPLNDLWNIFL